MHSSHGWLTPAARTTVKGAPILRVHRSGAETLDGRRSGGYALCVATGDRSTSGLLFMPFFGADLFRLQMKPSRLHS